MRNFSTARALFEEGRAVEGQMGSRRVRPALRLVGRILAVTSAAALVGATTAGGAHAAPRTTTEYDGDATALRIEGLRLELLPNGTAGLPKQVSDALKPLEQLLDQARAHGPDELGGDNLNLVLPDQVIGHAEFPDVNTQGEIPDNPLLGADAIEARSVEAANGNLLSEASVAGLNLGGGLLSADVIRSRCVGTGDRVALDVSQLALRSNQDIVETEVELEPGTAVPIEGMGTITYNQQDTDGTTYAEGTNVEIAIDSDLSLAALARMFGTTAPAMESAVKEVLRQLSTSDLGGQTPLQPVGDELDRVSGQQLYDGIDEVLDQINRQAPPQVAGALNNIAHFGGTITISNAACSQAQSSESAPPPPPQEPQKAVPAEPVSHDDNEPPLADTGSPAGMLAAGLAGLLALAGGGVVLLRLRRGSV
jgi:hypothetical protein